MHNGYGGMSTIIDKVYAGENEQEERNFRGVVHGLERIGQH